MEINDEKTQLLPPTAIWVLSAADKNLGEIIITPKQVMTFGRKSECDVVIPSQYVSRRHAEVFVEGNQLFVRDLDSTHGTIVNGEPIKQAMLQEGDEIRVDKAIFVVKRLEPASERADSAAAPEDADKTVMRSAADMAASLDKALADAKQAQKPAASKKVPDEEKPAVAVPPPEPPPAASPPNPEAEHKQQAEPSGSGDAEGSEKRSKNWWDPQDAGPMGTRFIKATDIADMVDREIAPLVEADGPMLLGLSPSISSLRIELKPGKLVVGKKVDADIRLDDEFVSDVHAQIIGEGERWKVVNVLSANGTFVNGKKVQSAYLRSGDVLRFGGLDIQFVNGTQSGQKMSRGPTGKGKRVSVVAAVLLLLVVVIAAVVVFTGRW